MTPFNLLDPARPVGIAVDTGQVGAPRPCRDDSRPARSNCRKDQQLASRLAPCASNQELSASSWSAASLSVSVRQPAPPGGRRSGEKGRSGAGSAQMFDPVRSDPHRGPAARRWQIGGSVSGRSTTCVSGPNIDNRLLPFNSVRATLAAAACDKRPAPRHGLVRPLSRTAPSAISMT